MSGRSKKSGSKKKKRKAADGGSGLASATRLFCLGLQRDFACVNCGACCSIPWKIPVEKSCLNAIRRSVKKGDFAPPDGQSEGEGERVEDWIVRGGAGEDSDAVYLKYNEKGECRFLEWNGERSSCAVHGRIGAEALCYACRLYPRMCVLQPLGVFLSLSHYCPAAAEMLFRDDLEEGEDLEIVLNPPAYPRTAGYGGLDARNHPPPLLRPNVLMTWESAAAWERHTLDVMGRKDYSPEEALVVLMTAAEKARAWNAAEGRSLPDFLEEVLKKERGTDPEAVKSQIAGLPSGLPFARQIYDRLLALSETDAPGMEDVLAEFRRRYASGGVQAATERFVVDYDRFVRPAWGTFERAVRRYLATKLFANYHLYQGDGLRTGLYAVAGTLACLRVHAALLCGREDKELDRQTITLAFCHTDLLLEHGLSRGLQARFYSRIETADLAETLRPVPH